MGFVDLDPVNNPQPTPPPSNSPSLSSSNPSTDSDTSDSNNNSKLTEPNQNLSKTQSNSTHNSSHDTLPSSNIDRKGSELLLSPDFLRLSPIHKVNSDIGINIGSPSNSNLGETFLSMAMLSPSPNNQVSNNIGGSISPMLLPSRQLEPFNNLHQNNDTMLVDLDAIMGQEKPNGMSNDMNINMMEKAINKKEREDDGQQMGNEVKMIDTSSTTQERPTPEPSVERAIKFHKPS